MSAPETPLKGVHKAVLRLESVLVDTVLIATLLLMAELMAVTFSCRRGPTGLLLSAEEILGLLHYSGMCMAALFAAFTWNLFYHEIGCSPGRAMMRGTPDWERDLPWHHTLRGWFVAVFVEYCFFTGWVITEVNVGSFLTQFGKAWDIIRGLMHPAGSILDQGLVLLVQTVFLAFMATAFAIPIAFVIAFLAARNLTRATAWTRLTYTVARTVMNFVRAVEPLVWALIFISWVGIGPFAGVLALWVASIASLVKLYSEAIESIDSGPMDAVAATGASTLQVLRYGVVPQVIPPFLSFTIYRWDINVRMSTIIGFVGGGGIGYILKPRVDLGEWGEVGTLVLLIAGTVWLMDMISAKIREKIV